jgi:hypothetical protein
MIFILLDKIVKKKIIKIVIKQIHRLENQMEEIKSGTSRITGTSQNGENNLFDFQRNNFETSSSEACTHCSKCHNRFEIT